MVSSAGDDAIEFAESLGYELDDWQKWLIRGMLAEDRLMRLCASVICIIVSRQNGKNVCLEVVELYCFYVLGWRYILHTAYRQDTSATHMARLQEVVEANPGLDEITVFSVSNGKERMYRTDTKAVMRFVTRGSGSVKAAGRGPSPQLVVFDEALYLDDAQIKATIPSLSAQTMKEDMPMMIYTSSAPEAGSVVLHRVRNQFIKGMLDGFFAEWSLEHSEEEPADFTDVENWYATNPALGIRISEEWVRKMELAIMDLEDFANERLGVPIGTGDSLGEETLPQADWSACFDEHSEVDDSIPTTLALAVGPYARWASFAEVGQRSDGLLHVELLKREVGTDWCIRTAIDLTRRLGVGLVVDPSSPTSALMSKLRKAGIDLIEAESSEYAEYCAELQEDVLNHRLRHLSQAPLNAAVVGASIRTVGERWVWSQKSSEVDITSLVAITLAAGRARAEVTEGGDLWVGTS